MNCVTTQKIRGGSKRFVRQRKTNQRRSWRFYESARAAHRSTIQGLASAPSLSLTITFTTTPAVSSTTTHNSVQQIQMQGRVTCAIMAKWVALVPAWLCMLLVSLQMRPLTRWGVDR
jgi:hypothetical protein